ncbi:MAG: dipeptide ABC transporter ATP-binding protein [Desulfobulbaceae bacterium]|nr:dipeptide ABC transporter ATP-binding protein [Desulfobulbaceae bacterium]
MKPLLTIDNLNLAFCADQEAGGRKTVLHDVSLQIRQGETHALVGESGSGKSVTAMSILRLLDEVSQIKTSGHILFQEQDLLQKSLHTMRKIRGNEIAMIFQEPMTALNPVYTIGSQLLEPLLLHRQLTKAEAWEQGMQLLTRCGIQEPEYRMNAYPHQLSGGQRQRVMIAMALACRPKLLIADEPTTALDVTIQQQILELIMDIQQEYHMAVLLITHDLPMVRQIAETVSIMHQGRIVEQGKTEKIFHNPQDPYTIHLLKSLPREHKKVRSSSGTLIDLKNIRCQFTLSKGNGFFKQKKNILKAVDDVSLTIGRGTTLGIVGESGSGKSTLAMCLLKLTRFNGKIIYNRRGTTVDLARLSSSGMRPLRKELQIIFQDPFSSLSPRLSVEQIIGEGLKVHGIGSKKERREKVAEVLEEVELEPDMAARFPHEFSGGQRQRIAIARAIVLQPELLILDEPTSALDMTIQAQVIELLKNLQQRHGMTYIFITHDLRVIRSLADELAVMQHGRIVEHGPADRLFTAPRHPYTQKLFQAAFLKADNLYARAASDQ